MANPLRIGIAVYGKLGKGAAAAVAQNPDMVLHGIFSRRDPATLAVPAEVAPVYRLDEVLDHKDSIDVLILCGGSKDDLPEQGPDLAAHFTTVYSGMRAWVSKESTVVKCAPRPTSPNRAPTSQRTSPRWTPSTPTPASRSTSPPSTLPPVRPAPPRSSPWAGTRACSPSTGSSARRCCRRGRLTPSGARG